MTNRSILLSRTAVPQSKSQHQFSGVLSTTNNPSFMPNHQPTQYPQGGMQAPQAAFPP